MKISINGKLIDKENAVISPLNEGFMYGYGLFETVKVYNNKLFFLKNHLQRLEDGCNILGLNSFNYDEIEKDCLNLIKVNNLINGAIKIIYSKEDIKNNVIIVPSDKVYSNEDYINGFKLTLSECKRDPNSKIIYTKSLNYVENIIEKREAVSKGFNEAIFTNINDEICEGTISNIFFIKNNKFFTPSLSCGLLNGIMRRKIIKLIKSLNYDIIIGKFKVDDLVNADEIFLTNSLMDIMPVGKFLDTKYDLDKNINTKKLIIKKNEIFYNKKQC